MSRRRKSLTSVTESKNEEAEAAPEVAPEEKPQEKQDAPVAQEAPVAGPKGEEWVRLTKPLVFAASGGFLVERHAGSIVKKGDIPTKFSHWEPCDGPEPVERDNLGIIKGFIK